MFDVFTGWKISVESTDTDVHDTGAKGGAIVDWHANPSRERRQRSVPQWYGRGLGPERVRASYGHDESHTDANAPFWLFL